jgi:hypothetical protein
MPSENFYAPVLIGTLCRYEKFKQSLESLAANPYAKYTDVYIALDYPCKDEHWEGYRKICSFLKQDFGFQKLEVFRREKNFGPHQNFKVAREEIFVKYDRIIVSEDDNVFSPNFLEYMDKCLEKYENNESILAICGYLAPVKILYGDNTIFKNHTFYHPWGVGFWREKYKTVQSRVYDEKFYKELLTWKNMLHLFLFQPKIFIETVRYASVKPWLYDGSFSAYLCLQKAQVIFPVVSKVKNIGVDSSATAKHFSDPKYINIFKNQIYDKNSNFFIIEDDSYNICNDRIFNAIGKEPFGVHNRKHLLREFLRFILFKIFNRSLKYKKHYNPYTCDGV